MLLRIINDRCISLILFLGAFPNYLSAFSKDLQTATKTLFRHF